MLFTEDATYYSEQIKAGKITSEALVQRALDNISIYNPALNAVVHVQAEEALTTAREYDRKLQSLSPTERQSLPVFFGIPTLLKDLYQSQKDQPLTNGAKLEENNTANETDNFVHGLLDVGFIIVGRTNVSEFGFKNQSDSEFSGNVHSPIDLDLNPGGSSGGAAAALKAGLVPLVSASDGGGSIRMPASFTGLIGLKPSRGRTPVGPGSFRGWQGASVHFAITKSVRDTWHLLKALQVQQLEAPFSLPLIEEVVLTQPKAPLHIAYSMISPIGTPVNDEAKKAILTTVEALESLGHICVEKTPETDGIHALHTYYLVNEVETASTLDAMAESLGRELTPTDMEPLSWGLYEVGHHIPAVEYTRLLGFWDQLTAKMESFFGEYDLLIQPATNGPSVPQDYFALDKDLIEQLQNIQDITVLNEKQKIIREAVKKNMAYTPWSQQQNLTGQPAMSLPLYETAEGLPVGTQFWTRKGNEYTLLQLAYQLEKAGVLKISITKEK